MNRKPIVAVMVVAVLLVAACGRRRIAGPVQPPPAPKPKPASLVVLLEDPDKKTGRIVVQNTGGSAELTVKNTAVAIVAADQGPAPVPIDEAEIQRRFGPVLAALPAPEARFTLHFRENSDEITAESAGLLAQIARTVRERQSTFVSVTGHTDTTGAGEANYQLGLRRATRLADFVKSTGVAANVLWIGSHGEGDLLVQTPDNTAEPRNRRVEVVIR